MNNSIRTLFDNILLIYKFKSRRYIVVNANVKKEKTKN